jgi:hypothetical protein
MAFTFKLENEDGTPADPPVLHTAVPNWQAGDTIPLGADRTLRIIAIRDDDADQAPVLVVEDSSQTGTDEASRLSRPPLPTGWKKRILRAV